MLLREHLNRYTKKELLSQARSLELKGYSGLCKSDLIDKIVEYHCEEERLRNKLTCLTNEQLQLFRKACVAPQDISIDDAKNGFYLYGYLLGYLDESTDRFYVFDDVAEYFYKIYDEAFKEEQRKKEWMIKCAHFGTEYYGIAPLEIIYKMYRLKIKCTIDEMIDMMWKMPVNVLESCIYPISLLGDLGLDKDDLFYTSKGMFIQIKLIEDDEISYLLGEQMDKEFYIPSAQQIEEIYIKGYESSSNAYKKLETFFIKKMNMSYGEAVTCCLWVWISSYEGKSSVELIDEMTERNVTFDCEDQIYELMDLLSKAYNNTRMKENRGFKPDELAKKRFGGGSITSINFPNGLDGKPVKTNKKVYPNDPCPCGSGKKYKKCCGKN